MINHTEGLSEGAQRFLMAIYILANGRVGVAVDSRRASQLVAGCSAAELQTMVAIVTAEKRRRGE